ncbi:MAG TPA: cobalamin biosynthesis protein CbiX [Candidatus Didemnitutus sp.]|nr:cobalamin biosynthesis protein CbiX [Candidatus Didemnitutus sp.]
MSAAETLLVDNGSLAPPAILALRRIAHALAQRIGTPVSPVSMLHSSTVDPAQLDGTPAEIFVPALARRVAGGEREFVVVPLFFGPSGAITDYLPTVVRAQQERTGTLNVRVAPPLFDAADDRLAGILADHVRKTVDETKGRRVENGQPDLRKPISVALVDHGSPARAVVAVRDALALQLAKILGDRFRVAAASMERRPGREYEFGEPLLASLLRRADWRDESVIVAMQFLLPGRHAGPDGDVAQICREAEAESPRLHTTMTTLVGESPLLIDILADRWRAAMD